MKEENLKERIIANGLYALPGVGSKRLIQLSEALESREAILSSDEEMLREILKKQLPKSLVKLRADYRDNPETVYKRMEQFYSERENEGIHFVYYSEEHYPNRLKRITDPPFGIFYKGKLPDQNKPIVSIIGARECSEYGKKCAELFGKTLAEYDVTIISGMARGVDGISQNAALEAGGESFGILGSGVDICYPTANRSLYERLIECGGVLSEFQPGTPAKTQNFPARNRIISGLCDILLVVEARKKSGTYITVCQALEQGREIFAVPGRITDGLSDGCNRLIAEGAGIAADPMVLLDALCGVTDLFIPVRAEVKSGDENTGVNEADKYEAKFAAGSTGTVLRAALLRILEETPMKMEDILELLNKIGLDVSYSELLCELISLCIEGKAEGIGNYYRKTI